MIDEKLLEILACPETKKDLELASSGLVEKINQHIEKGILVNKAGQKITEKIDGGLLRKGDTKYLYPIRNNIPILLIDELIVLDKISAS